MSHFLDVHDPIPEDYPKASVSTPASKLRGNKVHRRLSSLCLDWVKRNHPKVVERLRRQAKKEEAGRG